MRNLIPVHRSLIRAQERCPFKLVNVTVNADGLPLLAFNDGENIHVHEKSSTDWVEWPAWPGADIVTVLAAEPSIYVLSNGDIVQASADGATIVGGLDAEIAAAEWSPDGEILMISTKEKSIFLSRDMDLISEHTYAPEDLKLSKHVNVGWGKKETQFQGRGAKAVRDPTMPEKVDSGVLNPDDSGKYNISWRGDGEYVALSSIEDQRRVLRIFNREGVLSSVSEPCDYQTDLVAWRPSGSIIASVQESEHQVIFFERNGLRRYEFKLPTDAKVRGLSWSFDSDILAVQYDKFVELWTTKNYHWYRKQVLRSHTCQEESITWIKWHPEKRTLMIQWGEIVETHTFAIGIFGGPTRSPNDEGTVAVIDGEQILVTPLGKFNIPPPLSKSKLQVHDAIHVAVDETSQNLAITTCEGVVLSDGTRLTVEGAPRQAAYGSAGLVVLSDDDSGRSLLTVDGVPVETPANIMLLKGDFYETIDGNVYDFDGALRGKLGQRCVDFCVSDEVVFGLTEKGALYVWENLSPRVLARGITSMILTNNHLLVTTPTMLKFIHLSDIVVPDDDVSTEQCREIERGSLLVTAVPSRMQVILQALRGNLETIYPRMFVLTKIRERIRDLDYKAAYSYCRVHRIDLNFLYDYAPELFEKNISQFLDSLSEDYIDLFLGALKDEDVVETKYRDTSISTPEQRDVRGKANRISDLVGDKVSSIQNKITALACKNPPDLQNALVICKNEKDIQHLVFLTDAEMLYKTALGMYDLQLALTVAQQAQKDPKEYLAFLRARDKENEMRRRFVIDDYLRNYKKALGSLLKDENASDEEILEYVERHELYDDALLLLRGDDRENKILRVQADYLLQKARYEEAGLNFEYLGLKERAVDAYTVRGDWRRALSLDPSKALDLADSCVALKKFHDAGEIYAYHLKQPDLACEYYGRAYRYDDAILLATNAELFEIVDESLRENFGVVQELLADCRKQIPSQLNRLRELRAKRQEVSKEFTEHTGNDLEDTMSIAGTETTHASFMTRYTDKTGGTAQTGASRRTQKNRRREERKRARGKKGTVYEEEYLVASMGRLMDRVNSTRPDAQNLADGLKRRRMRELALELQTLFAEVVAAISESVDEFYDIQEEDLVRYDQEGNRYLAPRPVPPQRPSVLS